MVAIGGLTGGGGGGGGGGGDGGVVIAESEDEFCSAEASEAERVVDCGVSVDVSV